VVRSQCRGGGVLAWGLALAAGAVAPRAVADITFGQVDDFEDGTPAGWSEGFPSQNPPTNVATGGPGGAGDHYLQNVSAGIGSGSHQVMFDRSRWTGDFGTAGVTRVEADLANFGATPLAIRVAIKGQSLTWWSSTDPIALPPDGTWRHVAFGLDMASLSLVTGPDSLETVRGAVQEFRVVSAEAGPSYLGEDVDGTLGMDNFRALRLAGDATFDDRVDFNDLVKLAQNYNTSGGLTWREGDFTFDGAVDFNDLVKLAQNYNTGPGVAGLSVPGAPEGFDRDVAAAFATVPEPSAVAFLLSAGVVTAVGRRRRRIS
jgi:hypothetical protein